MASLFQVEAQNDSTQMKRVLQRRDGASNVFYDDPTLALDYWHAGEEKPLPLWKRLLYRLSSPAPVDNQRMGIYDLEMVKLHLPTLLKRRNASVSIKMVNPEQVKQTYEQAECSETPKIVDNISSDK